PSEVTKIALILALSRYFHGSGSEDCSRISHMIVPVVMICVPIAFVLRQPDLGTATMLMMVSATIMFAAGVRLWMFAAVGAAVLAVIPIAWGFLHDYQQQRVLTFLNPESDPL